MNISQTVARIYAEALLDLAIDQDELGKVVDDLHAVRGIYDADPFFRKFFHSPRLDPEAKQRALSAALGDRIGRSVMGLLHVLVRKRREPIFDNICDEFDRFRDIREGRLHAHVVSAEELDDAMREHLKERLERVTGKTIILHERVQPGILGGLVVRVGDRVIDGSVRRRLSALRSALAAAAEHQT